MLSHHRTAPLLQRTQKAHCRGSLYTTSSVHNSFTSREFLSYLFVLLSWSSLIHTAVAETHGDRPSSLVEDVDLPWIRSPLQIDLRPPPIIPLLMPPIYSNEEVTTTLSAPPAKRSTATNPKGGNSDFVVPQPLDAGLSNNFTNSCASFINRLRTNDTFKNCHPFSLLLQVCFRATLRNSVLIDNRRRADSLTPQSHFYESPRHWTQLAVRTPHNAKERWTVSRANYRRQALVKRILTATTPRSFKP
jgi:hypothetical protein